ncbi:hypothetical protein FRC01_003627, partial [Tulasnella sp. 417]
SLLIQVDPLTVFRRTNMAEGKTKVINVPPPVVRPGGAERSYLLVHEPGEPTVSVRAPTVQERASIQAIPPEVMSMIFAMSNKLTCAAACLVCRRWSGAAIDELWRSLPSLRPLFQLLGPLVRTDSGLSLHPECVLTERSWDLFRSYAARVQSLTHDEVVPSDGISAVLITRTLAIHPGGILPNLRAVDWHICERGLSHPLAFCPPSLERMVLRLGDDDSLTESAIRLLYDLSSSLANRLKYFKFGTTSSYSQDADLATALTAFLKTQSNLLELKLPEYAIQYPVVVATACQASMHLRTFSAQVHDVTREMFRVILGASAERGDSLRCIWLTRTGYDLYDETICLADIQPMLQLTVIEEIRFWHEGKLELTAPDIRQMGQAWQGLTSLMLHPDGEPGIPLSQLATFAQWFPALQRFAARFDCAEYTLSAYEVPSRFKSLRRLTWFDAKIADSQRFRVAEFLAAVLGPDVELGIREFGLDSFDALEEALDWEIGSGSEKFRDLIDAFYQVHEAISKMK